MGKTLEEVVGKRGEGIVLEVEFCDEVGDPGVGFHRDLCEVAAGRYRQVVTQTLQVSRHAEGFQERIVLFQFLQKVRKRYFQGFVFSKWPALKYRV